MLRDSHKFKWVEYLFSASNLPGTEPDRHSGIWKILGCGWCLQGAYDLESKSHPRPSSSGSLLQRLDVHCGESLATKKYLSNRVKDAWVYIAKKNWLPIVFVTLCGFIKSSVFILKYNLRQMVMLLVVTKMACGAQSNEEQIDSIPL